MGYDRANLVADTLSLLSPDAPILARMENMRRATIQWFDAGYLVDASSFGISRVGR